MPKRKARRLYSSSRDNDHGLGKIIAGLVLVCAIGFGVMRFAGWFREDFVTPEAEAAVRENLDRAERLFAKNQYEEARQHLAPVLARATQDQAAFRAHSLQSEIDEHLGDIQSAMTHLKTVVEDYEGYAGHPSALARYARLLERTGAVDEANALYVRVRDTAPPEIRASALTGIARQLEREGDIDGAYELYTRALDEAAFHSQAWDDAMDALGRFNVERIFSSARTADSRVYHVTRGDTLTSIGIKLNTTQGLLMRANDMTDPNRLHLGQQLKHTPKDFRIVIERSTCRLYLVDSDGLFKMYRVGLGKPSHETVLGRYRIGNKEKNPTWHKPGATPIPPGDPNNELGTRWIPMVPEAENLPSDLGIHGTIRPLTVGKYESNGCPRLLNEEVEELYDLVVRSTPILVVEEFRIEDLG